MNNMSRLVVLLLWLPLVASAIPRAINPVDVMVVDSGSVQPKLWSIDSLVSDSVVHADYADTADVANQLKNNCQPNDTANRWGMNTQAKYGGRIIEAVDCDANLGNDTPMIWVERKHDGNWSGIGDPSTPAGVYVQHEQTGSGTAFTHSVMALGINSGSGDNDVIASSGRVIKRSGLGDACGVWGSAYDSTATDGGVMGLEGHIYQNVTGMVAKDTLGARWSAALHLYSGSLQSDALAGVAISSFAPTIPYRFWNGILLDMNAFRRTGTDPVAGTVGLNMARATPYYGIKFGHCNKQIACTDSFKIGLSSGYYAYIISPQNSYLHLNGNGNSGLIVDAGIGPTAGNQNAFIDIKSNSVLKGNIAYTESDGKISINSAVTTGLSLCSGGGITTIEKRAKVVGGLDLDSIPNHPTDSVVTVKGDGLVGYRPMSGMKVDSARIAGSMDHNVDPLHIPVAKDAVSWKSTGMTYDTTTNYFTIPRYLLFDSSSIQDVYINTADGYDDKSLTISPSGQGAYANRGAWSIMTGNEHALNGDWWMSTGEEGAFKFFSAVGFAIEWDGIHDNNDRFIIKPGTGTVQTDVGTDSGPLRIYADGSNAGALIMTANKGAFGDSLTAKTIIAGSATNSTKIDSNSIISRKWMDTPEGGRAIKIVNRTGATSVKGYMVRPSPSYDTACTLSIVDVPDPIGVVYEAGVSDGSEMWVVTNGYADIYFIGNATRGHIARGFVTGDAGYVAGQAVSEAFPTSPFATDKHFYEIGHVIQSRTGAGLARCVLHQN